MPMRLHVPTVAHQRKHEGTVRISAPGIQPDGRDQEPGGPLELVLKQEDFSHLEICSKTSRILRDFPQARLRVALGLHSQLACSTQVPEMMDRNRALSKRDALLS
jgi:hypothetical protein